MFHLERNGDRSELVVGWAVDPAERLRSEVWRAVESWLADTDRPLVLDEEEPAVLALRPPGD